MLRLYGENISWAEATTWLRGAIMIKQKVLFLSLLLLVPVSVSFGQDAGKLWPEIQPYYIGYLKVSPLHEIFYQTGGNPKGKPVLYLHGGPGGGCSPHDFRYFNPHKFNIILHDQRGSGKSKPYAEIRENTTENLVEDIEKLRKHLGLDRVILFGGSWGSTLALAYAEKYPQNVRGIVLRGVFTANRSEIDHYYHGGTAKFFPEVYQELTASLDHPEKKDFPAQLLAKLTSADPAVRDRSARAWVRYEGKIAFLLKAEEKVEVFLRKYNPYAIALLENYYMANGCFLEEGQLQKNAGTLADIPMVIINGRYDMICPPTMAYNLHRLLPKSMLVIVPDAGHSAGEPGIEAELVKAMRRFED
jgi:proline iminopeptidase